MARKPGRQSRPGVFKPRAGHRSDGRKRNKGVPLSRLVQLRADVVQQQTPDEKTFTSKSAYKFAQRQLRENGVRYQIFHVAKGEYVAVKLDAPLDDVKRSEEFQRTMRTLKKERDRSANGPLARALVELGLRDRDWSWAVGETNND
jgi:hypothetical protein